MDILIKKKLPEKSEVYDTYWKFAKKRQDIFFNRINGVNEWTIDPILKKYKFTNVYRATDRVSQYLIRNVIYRNSQESKEVLFRILLFKTFNKIETWESLTETLGPITYSDFNFEKYDKKLTELMESGRSIYSGAYIMASGRSIFGYPKKHRNHLKLIQFMMKDNLTRKIEEQKSMEGLFKLLKSYPTIGNFLAYQYATDINYSELCTFDEMNFVFPGPGALDGIKKCFVNYGQYSESDIIKYVAQNQEKEFNRLGLDFKSLWGRELQLIDCQNIFCEVDKYSRVAHPDITGLSGRKKIKQKFTPNNKSIDYWFPPKWGINNKITHNYE